MFYYDEYDINYFEEKEEEIKNYIGKNEIEEINYSQIKVGDKIIINFYPYSQKYIYILYPKYGKVIENIDKNNIIIKNDKKIYNIFHEGVSIINNGYDYRIFRII